MRKLAASAVLVALVSCATGAGVNSGLHSRTYRAEADKVWQEARWLVKQYESEQLGAANQASMVYRGMRTDREAGTLALDLLDTRAAPAQRPQQELVVGMKTGPEGITVTARVLPLNEGEGYRPADGDREAQRFLDRLDVQMGVPRLIISGS